MFIGLVLGGILVEWDWRAVFWINVPVGVFGTLWAYLRLRDNGERHKARIDWWGNITFALGLGAILIACTYGIQPYHGSSMGWESPVVLGELIGGIILLIVFVIIESRLAEPMFRIGLFRIRAFAFGNLAGLLVSIARGGIQFMLIIWLQGIWLPVHGYTYEQTPLWAGIFMLPMTAGFLVSGPASGILSDKFGSRGIATSGMAVFALSFVGLILLLGDVRLAELLLHHGQRPGARAGRGLWHARDLPEFRDRRVHRRGLHADDRGPVELAAVGAERRADPPRRAVGRGPPARVTAAGIVAVRLGARRQPNPATARPVGALAPAGGEPGDADRGVVLPQPADRSVPQWLGGGVQRLGGLVGARGPGVPAAGIRQGGRGKRGVRCARDGGCTRSVRWARRPFGRAVRADGQPVRVTTRRPPSAVPLGPAT
jgi:hypothetical protein